MSEVLASLKQKGGGEKYTETVLWTNPDPTSNFTGQNVTLSDSISNYKYIKFTWKTTTTDTTSSSAYVLSSDLASMINSNGSRFLSLSSLWTNVYSRNITYNSATSVSIATSTRQGASGSNNGVNIPLEILGINELDHAKGFDESVLWTNNAPTSTFAGQEIDLSNDIDNYDYIGIKYYYNTTYQTGHADSMTLVSVSDLKKWLYQDSVRHNIGSLSMEFGGTAYSRTVYYVSDTKIRFGSSYQVGSASTSNGTCLPYSVIGCKFR